MEQPTLSDESNVTLLLTSHLGAAVDETSDDTLGPTQWHDFTRAVNESSLDSIGELLSLDTSELPATLFSDKISREWVTERLSNASRLALELEDLNQRLRDLLAHVTQLTLTWNIREILLIWH